MALAQNDYLHAAPESPSASEVEPGLGEITPAVTDLDAYRRLRICHLGKYYPPATGGIEAHVQTIARAQADLGADVRVICINHLNHSGHDVTWNRYGITRSRNDNDGKVRVRRLSRSGCVARLDIVPRLPHVLSELTGQVDVLHLHTPNPTMVAALAALRLPIPIVVTHHSDVIRQRLLRYAYGPLERLVYRRAAMVMATTKAYADGSEVLRSHSDKVHLLPMGIDLTRFARPSAAAVRHARFLREDLGPVIWLAVGRCVYYKGLHTAISALRNTSGKLLVIGSGPMEKPLREHATRMHVNERIIWWGHATQDELVGSYLAATALWFPSTHKSEAYGLVQVEAMASGCPVINADVVDSGVTWVSRHEESGLTVPIESPTALAEAANRIASDPALRERLAAGARQRAQAEFDHQVMAVRSLNAYRNVIEVRQEVGAGRALGAQLQRRSAELAPRSNGKHVDLAF